MERKTRLSLSQGQQRCTPPPDSSRRDVDIRENAMIHRRRRCKSEGLETSPFDRKSTVLNRDNCNCPTCSGRLLSDRLSECCRHRISNIRWEQMCQFTHNGYNGYPMIADSVQAVFGRKKSISPVRHSPAKSKYLKEGNGYYCSRNGHLDSSVSNRSRSPNRFIENEKPQIVKQYERELICQPDYDSHKTPLKSLVNNKRRSASPPSRKSPEKLKNGLSKPAVISSEGKRRQRAISESDCHCCITGLCADINDRCPQQICDPSMLKRAREDFSQPILKNAETTPRVSCLQNHCTKDNSLQFKEAPRIPEDHSPLKYFETNGSHLNGSTILSTSKSSPMKSCIRPRIRMNPTTPTPLTNGSSDSNKPMEISDTSIQLVTDNGITKGLGDLPLEGISLDEKEGILWIEITRPSLFPLVAPYLRFFSHHLGRPVSTPAALSPHLKWRLTSITPVVVRRTLTNSGFKLVKAESDILAPESDFNWVGIWGKHMKSICFKTLRDGQKMNHFPGSFHIGRKDRLWRNLQKMVSKYGRAEFGMMPLTYVLPHDLKILKREWEKHSAAGEKWIIKPPASARGTGIKVVSRWTQIPKKRPIVVQRYISRPLLIHESKFDIRLYVLVTSMHPLRIYLYPDGLARFASVKYSDEVSSLQDRYMHLTNYSINRLSKSYQQNEEAEACQGHKWTLQSLLTYLENERNINVKELWEKFKDVVIKTIICGESNITMQTRTNVPSRYNCYELFGVDILLDEELKPWLLEVNISPSLHSASPLDLHVKGPLVVMLLNMAQYHVPLKVKTGTVPRSLGNVHFDKRLYTVFLSKEEKDKHDKFTMCEYRSDYLNAILDNLTADDVRHLIQAEDELVAANILGRTEMSGRQVEMERIFPTTHTHLYHRFFAAPRYYNRLFDAWEQKHANNRMRGINLLQRLCRMGKHLEMPSTPVTNEGEAERPREADVRLAEAGAAPARRRRLHSPAAPCSRPPPPAPCSRPPPPAPCSRPPSPAPCSRPPSPAPCSRPPSPARCSRPPSPAPCSRPPSPAPAPSAPACACRA